MKPKLVLSIGLAYGYGANGERVCTGSKMGRRDIIPDEADRTQKLYMTRLRWVDGDYDPEGCYWGNTGKDHVYCAHNSEGIQLFGRGRTSVDAKRDILSRQPWTKFFR